MKKVILLLTLLTSIFILLLSTSGYSTEPKQVIIWQNQSSGDIVFWHMDGTTLLSQSLIGNVPDTNWKIVDYADFNEDGNPDLLWQNQATGDVCIWLMDGTAVIGAIAAGGVGDPYWRIVSAADFNGDGNPDYLWQHQQRGDLYTWFIDWYTWWGSVIVTGGAPSGGVSDPDWKIVGVADFNGDGNSDYLWQHQLRSDIYVWFMDGTNPVSGYEILWYGDRDWKIVDAADFNNDGKPDILWRHPVSGQNLVWFMDGINISGYAFLDTITDTNWIIAATNNLPPDGSISLPKTGQTTSYYTGDDGYLEKGVAWPTLRFTVSGDCVTDNLTGLMWAKNANLPNGTKTWQDSLDYIASMNSGAGLCGYHDWRLPNRKELRSLIDYSKYNPALPEGHPFTNVQSSDYWSSTTYASKTDNAWYVNMWFGLVHYYYKGGSYYVWPERAGQ
jgi:hypothetical protein